MIAIFDYSENKVVIVGDRLYRVSYEEFLRCKSLLESHGLICMNADPSSLEARKYSDLDSSSPVGGMMQADKSEDKTKHIGSVNGRCIVVNGLDPKLQFVGLDDVKSVDSLVKMYGKVPDEVNALVQKGTLLMMGDAERAERIAKTKEKQAVKGKKISQASSKSVRLAESYSESDDSFSDSSEDEGDFEDRLRNAVKIDIKQT